MTPTNEVGLASERIRAPSGAVLEDLHCSSICHNILWKPVACQTCETHFCKACIDKWFSVGRSQCPIGCDPFIERPCSKFITNHLSKLQVVCIYKPKGCHEIVPYEAVEKHETTCDYQPQPCPGCHSVFTKKEIEKHKSQCESIDLICQNCKITYKQHDIHTDMSCLKEQFRHYRHQSEDDIKGLKEEIRQLKEEPRWYQYQLQEEIGQLKEESQKLRQDDEVHTAQLAELRKLLRK